MQETTNRYVFDNPIKLGSTIDTKPLYFIQIIDLDNSLTKLPFNNYEITIRDLIENYYDVSTCLHLVKGQIRFKILQGPLNQKYSADEFKLSSLSLAYDQPCFQVKCYQNQNQLESQLRATTSKIQEIQQDKQFPLKVYFNMQKFELDVDLYDTISEVKLKLIAQRPQFKKTSKDMIKIIFGNDTLSDQAAISDYKGIKKGSTISVVLRINEGCFRGCSKITLADRSIKRMDEVKSGQQILSYNQTEDIFEKDIVTYIHRSFLEEQIILSLSNGEEIHTTSNHLFMCHDKIFRKIQPDRSFQSLKVGTLLKTLKDKPSQIVQIKTKILNPPIQFFHFFVKKNHNFIVNTLIAHNMFYEVDYEGLTDKLNLPESQLICNIKKVIQQTYQYHTAHHLLLLNNGFEIKNNSTLNDFGIKKQSRLNIVRRQPQSYNLLHSDTKIRTDKGIITVGQLAIDDKIIQYRPDKSQSMLRVIQIVKNNPNEKYCLTLSGNLQIIVSSLTYFEGQSGQAIIVDQIVTKIKQQSSVFLRTADGSMIRVEKAKKKAGNEYIHIVTQPKGSFIVTSNLIVHSTVITIVNKKQAYWKKYTLGLNHLTKIQQIQKMVISKLQLYNKEYIITSKGKQINKESSFSKQKIGTGDILVMILPEDMQAKKQKSQIQKQSYPGEYIIDIIMPNGSRYPVDYNKYKNKTAKEVMNSIQPDYKSSFYFLIGSQIILPIDTLNKIQTHCDMNLNEKISIMVVKNAKLSFLINMNLKDYEIRNISYIQNQEQASQISLINVNQQGYQYSFSAQYTKIALAVQNNKKLPMFQRRSIFYTPIVYFFHEQYRSKMADFMQNFQRHLRNQTEQQTFKMIKSLFISIAYLPNLIPRTLIETHFMIKKLRLARFYKKGDTFYFYQYLLTTNDEEQVQKSCGKTPSTFFHVTSTTCKNINSFSPSAGRYFKHPKTNSNVEEVNFIFYPFTYFVIDKIKTSGLIDQIWISEIASPITLQKDIILWVDDIPNNNSIAIKKILNTKQVQILQLLSTIQAQKWLLQFGWLMNWKNINFKLISDNGRLQYKQQSDQPVQDYEAGLDLMDRIYNKRQLTVKSYIFCGDKLKVEEILRTKPKYQQLFEKYNDKFKVTADGNEIISFACSEQW